MFRRIEKYCQRKKEKPVIQYLDKYTIEFTVKTIYYEKYFRIHYQDTETEKEHSKWDNIDGVLPRDNYQHYSIYFLQENYPWRGHFITIEDSKWLYNEEDTLNEIKRLCRNWKA